VAKRSLATLLLSDAKTNVRLQVEIGGESEMKFALAQSALIMGAIAGALVSSVDVSNASSNHWVDPVKLCAANPNCKQDLSNSASKHQGISHFVIRKFNGIISVRCVDSRDCRRMFPRGNSEPVTDLTSLFGAN
jgi:hypothetical protein